MIGIGVPVNILSMWILGHLSPASGFSDVNFGLILRGLGSGLLFTPLIVSAFAGLKGTQIAQGAGLMNLCRQLGGSLSIAFLSTYVDQMNDYHRTVLTSTLGPDNTMMQQRVTATAQRMVEQGYSPSDAQGVAVGILNHAVQIQSSMQSYDGTFLLVGIVFLVTYPLVLILRKPGKAMPSAGAATH